jgi:hypothetical protein
MSLYDSLESARTEPMDASADVVHSPEGERTPEGVEPGSLRWAHQHIEEVKAGLRDDPGINKARDQPGARHSIGVNSLACAPNASPNSPLERAA